MLGVNSNSKIFKPDLTLENVSKDVLDLMKEELEVLFSFFDENGDNKI
jgi:hypothetical protein